MKSYRDLEIYNLSFELASQIHYISLQLPKYENYELGSQIRRSSKSIVFNIVEGFGRRRYKKELIRFLIFAHASSDEVICQLEMIASLHKSIEGIEELLSSFERLSIKIYYFIRYVEKNWRF